MPAWLALLALVLTVPCVAAQGLKDPAMRDVRFEGASCTISMSDGPEGELESIVEWIKKCALNFQGCVDAGGLRAAVVGDARGALP